MDIPIAAFTVTDADLHTYTPSLVAVVQHELAQAQADADADALIAAGWPAHIVRPVTIGQWREHCAAHGLDPGPAERATAAHLAAILELPGMIDVIYATRVACAHLDGQQQCESRVLLEGQVPDDVARAAAADRGWAPVELLCPKHRHAT